MIAGIGEQLFTDFQVYEIPTTDAPSTSVADVKIETLKYENDELKSKVKALTDHYLLGSKSCTLVYLAFFIILQSCFSKCVSDAYKVQCFCVRGTFRSQGYDVTGSSLSLLISSDSAS